MRWPVKDSNTSTVAARARCCCAADPLHWLECRSVAPMVTCLVEAPAGRSAVLSHDWRLIYRVSIVFNRVGVTAAVTRCQGGAQQTGVEGDWIRPIRAPDMSPAARG